MTRNKRFLIIIDSNVLEEMKGNAEAYDLTDIEFIQSQLSIQPDQHQGIGSVIDFPVEVREHLLMERD